MKKFLPALLLIASVSSFADGITKDTGINYNEIGLSYFSIRISDKYDFNGYATKGSVLLTDNIFIEGTYANTSAKISSSSYTVTLREANLGYRLPIGTSTDFFGTIGYSGSTFTGDDDSSGYSVKLGVNSKLTDDLKISGTYKYSNVSNNDPYNTGGLEAQYYFTKSFHSHIGYYVMGGGATAKYYDVGIGYSF